MDNFLTWPPILWTGRLILVMLIVVAGGGAALVSLLYLARFLRPRHIRTLLTADLPKFHKVGGTAKVLGQELTLQADVGEQRDQQIDALGGRVESVERQLAEVFKLLDMLLPFSERNGKK